ncbi:hypothetical protein [uncultured Psychrobacter sp.]|uniref:hypothetical protein n=1 Tax=uncultured Psychrobacter sp. TaxID=259303 RepID=UPI00345B2C29
MDMSLNLSDYELNLVSSGLQIMLIENAKSSKEVAEKQIKQQYENLSLELFTLFSKVTLLDIDQDTDLSTYDLKLMKNGLVFLADYVYQKSLEKTEKDEIQYYENCNLQFIRIRSKINKMESYKLC